MSTEVDAAGREEVNMDPVLEKAWRFPMTPPMKDPLGFIREMRGLFEKKALGLDVHVFKISRQAVVMVCPIEPDSYKTVEEVIEAARPLLFNANEVVEGGVKRRGGAASKVPHALITKGREGQVVRHEISYQGQTLVVGKERPKKSTTIVGAKSAEPLVIREVSLRRWKVGVEDQRGKVRELAVDQAGLNDEGRKALAAALLPCGEQRLVLKTNTRDDGSEVLVGVDLLNALLDQRAGSSS